VFFVVRQERARILGKSIISEVIRQEFYSIKPLVILLKHLPLPLIIFSPKMHRNPKCTLSLARFCHLKTIIQIISFMDTLIVHPKDGSTGFFTGYISRHPKENNYNWRYSTICSSENDGIA